MARSIKKLSSFDKKIQKEIAELIEGNDIKMVDFPYKGEIERGIIWRINEEDSYLVVLDNFKSVVKLIEADEDDEDDDDDDTPEAADNFDGINEDIDDVEEDDDIDDDADDEDLDEDDED